MKILSMQATFGKLENQTVTFAPGMNVIHAPNEWGKSTWCAFIVAMLYGIDTRERTTQTALAEKERYAPWSGKPMAGRMDIEWNEKRITLERSTKGRSIFGVFKAYETESGLPVEELTAENCGLTLLGVEKSVFLKSAFIRQNDMPVMQDEVLRRRLNALVTTGDESGASDLLAQKLKDLKNQCRHNKTGQLPLAELQRTQITGKLEQLRSLQAQVQDVTRRKAALAQELQALQNHRDALAYQAAQADLRQVEKARSAADAARQQLQVLETACAALPTPEEARNTLEQLSQLQERSNCLRQQQMPALPDVPAQRPPFQGLDGRQAQDMASRDAQQYAQLHNAKRFVPYIVIAVLGLVLMLTVLFAFPQFAPLCWIPAGVCWVLLVIKWLPHASDKKLAAELTHKYGSADPTLWQANAQAHARAQASYTQAMQQYNTAREQLQLQQKALDGQLRELTQGAPISAAWKYWEQVQAQHRALTEAERAARQAQDHVQALEAMVRRAEPAKEPDDLSLSAAQTEQRLAALAADDQHLHKLLGQAQGQAETLGSEEQLVRALSILNERISRLEDIHSALILAQETLEEAALELQRRFAPKITQRASQLFGKLTDGRYDRLTMDQDLTLSTGAEDEDTLHTWLWRSDGTVDQLYLALRLAVAEELTPQAPIILDDALVRFDDLRMKKALEILEQAGIDRQVILFSCQNREKAWKNG